MFWAMASHSSSQPTPCKHCGTPVPSSRSDDFCCAGCSYVFQMLHESGLEHFYDLRGGQALSPVLPQSLREQDFTWMEPLKEKAEEQPQQAELTLSVQGLSCIGCIWLIDRVYTKAGGGRLSADIARGEMRMESRPLFKLVILSIRIEVQQKPLAPAFLVIALFMVMARLFSL